VWFISTPNGFNHFKTLAETQDNNWKYFHFTSYDNPFLDREEIETMKREMDEDSFQQEIMGEFRKMSGLIYKGFNRDIHMIDTPDLRMNYTFTRALDFGFAHKTALIYFAINSVGSEIYAFDGLYQTGLTEEDIAQAVLIKDAGRVISNSVADSAQPMSIEQLSRMGCRFDPVEKGPDSVKNGIVKVAELLKVRNDTGKPTLMFSKNLTWIADEFEKYRWVENKSSEGIREVPLKRDDDAMDCIRYFAMSYMKPQPAYQPINKRNWSIR
jgi:phage terminase large subunit